MAVGKKQWISIPFSVHERPYLKRVLNGIEAYARQRGNWRLRLPYYFAMTPLYDMAKGSGVEVDGQITGVPTRAHLKGIRELGRPCVLLNCSPPVPEWAGNVELDLGAIARLAVEHFDKQGFAQLAFFGSTHPERSDQHRYREAVSEAARRAGMAITAFGQLPPEGDWGDLAGQQAQWADWLGRLPAGTGIICGDDEGAARIYLASERSGRVIGEDLFVLGAGNEETLCEAMTPPLSSIQLDFFAMGWEAAAMLDGIMQGGKVPVESKRIAFASVIARQSSQPQAHRDARVERALGMIWKELGEGLTVEKVAMRVHMDRRHLHRLFMEQLGRSPMAEIQRARVETAKRMLCESTEHLSAIAAACGFSDQAHMARSIKKATGQTPGEFRLIGRRG
ncbi:MAG: substrate-binding domain-containing protein [Oceanipulchritudo sp.]